MIARFLLSLLLACLAWPALAMPVVHDMPDSSLMHHAMAGMDHAAIPITKDSDPAPHAMPDHACIGCIPLDAGLARAVLPNGFAMRLTYPALRARLNEAAQPSPDTPPPKLPA